MLTDYKFWYVKREGDTPETAVIIEVAVRFFEGAYELRENEAKQLVNTYVRAKRLDASSLSYIPQVAEKLTLEASGKVAVVFTPKDFGTIRTDDELRKYLNGIIAADTTRTVIAEQKVAK